MKPEIELARVLLLSVVLLALPDVVQAQYAYNTNADGSVFTYSTNNDGSSTVVAYTGPPWAVSIPTAFNGLTVTAIGINAFYDSSLTSVTIPYGVTTIGDYAFNSCFDLTNITIPSSVTSLRDSTFADCTSLANITIPDSITNLGTSTFHQSGLTSIAIPTNITSIGNMVFLSCFALTNVIIGNNITNFGTEAFGFCGSLTGIMIPNSVINIGDSAFQGCNSLTDITIPNSVTTIGKDAFYECTALASVTIGTGVTNVNYIAFAACPKLAGVYFLGNAPTIVTGAFTEDVSLKTLYIIPGTTGWSATGLPTTLWNPQAQDDASFGVHNNQFGFNITGSSNLVVLVVACTNLAKPNWSPVSTNKLNTFIGTNGASYFSDSQWTNYPVRFYRFRSP